ncbi:SIS domain-containing protein [Nonomuraea phyllanthi]|uniref:SIS domain-containing protein n=1 Tax=Nonomuraea phyllanthi TaxID=2219224 RepID=A0A5C4W213_9ACTN|nr:SIS domain-containing protein [Nonomuraea phyllanthi]KAB8191539.1 SIS domain-containing protein [Nonomuraea phyllanthi]QFY13134.1 SIS domain-containing protein [Nonomuraea phyllanthi]
MSGVLDQVRDAAGTALVEEVGAVIEAASAMSERFRRGGRLLAFGRGEAAADAAHVAVEFTHPVIVGKRALPALCLGAEPSLLPVLGRSQDIAVGVRPAAGDFAAARALGMLTVALTVNETGAGADHVLAARCDDPLVAGEIHVTVYHLLWELVHVFQEAGS